MANIAIATSWTNLDERRASTLDRLLRRLRALARLQRIAGVRRRTLRAVRADVVDARVLTDIGIPVRRNRGYDCIGWLAQAQWGGL